MKKFFSTIQDVAALMKLPMEERKIVFYSENRSTWVHLEPVLTAFLENNDILVCYVSSNSNDPGLQIKHQNLKQFTTDESWVRNWLFENIQTDVFVMTTPDLHQYQVKRSKHPVHYVYIHHSLVSCHMVYRKGAFDHFDTILCAGPHHIDEIRATEKYYELPRKHLLAHGYGRLDSIIASNQMIEQSKNKDSHIIY